MSLAAAAGKVALGYADAKGKKHAVAIGKKIVKKGAKVVKKAIAGKAKKYIGEEGLKAISSNFKPTAPPSKVHKEMIDKGMISSDKGTQTGAYVPDGAGSSKSITGISLINRHPTKKLLTEGRALTYGGEATMKTRR